MPFNDDLDELLETDLGAAVLPRFDCWIDLEAGATAATGLGAGSAGFGGALATTGLDAVNALGPLPSEATSGTPSRAANASYSLPSKLASKNFLNHWTNSKLSWKRPFTNFSTGIIYYF